MSENDFEKEIDKIVKRAVHKRKQELEQAKASTRDAHRITETEYAARLEQREKERTFYTAVIIAMSIYGIIK